MGVSSPDAKASHAAEMTKAGGEYNSTRAPELHFDPDTECSAAIIADSSLMEMRKSGNSSAPFPRSSIDGLCTVLWENLWDARSSRDRNLQPMLAAS